MTGKIISWIAQLALAWIMFGAAYAKFMGVEEVVAVFSLLGMGSFGMYLIGAIEFLGALFLLIPALVTLGAFLIFAVMLGAGIGHITVLGFEGSGMYFVALLLSVLILWLHRKKLPLIGKTM